MAEYSFVADHFPANHAALGKIFTGLGLIVCSFSMAVLFARDFLAKVERRRMFYLQRPPGVPVSPYNPIDDKSCYWLNRITRRRGNNIFSNTPTKMLRNTSLPSLAEYQYHDKKAEEPRFYRIIALDGGGVRGIITAVILQRLSAIFPGLIDNVDLLAGTSTGGLLCTLLASGYSSRQCVDIYRYNAPIMFEKKLSRTMNPFSSAYNHHVKREMLEFYAGKRTLGELNKYVVITAFRLDGGPEIHGRPTVFPSGKWRPCVFSNLPLGNGNVPPDNDLSIVDAAMRTSAAPTYFPIFQGYIDGAIFANNPSMPAISRACAQFGPHVSLDNVQCLSIGCGLGTGFISNEDCEQGDWGLRQWAPHLLELLTDATGMADDLYANLMLGKKYHRINPSLPRSVSIDDATVMDDMIQWAHEVDLQKTIDWITETGFARQVDT